jgi:hypothetical protein
MPLPQRVIFQPAAGPPRPKAKAPARMALSGQSLRLEAIPQGNVSR